MRCSTRPFRAILLAVLASVASPVEAAIVADAPGKANDGLLAADGAIDHRADPMRIRFDVVVEQLAESGIKSPAAGPAAALGAPPRTAGDLAPNLRIGDATALGIYGDIGQLVAAILLGTTAAAFAGLAFRRRRLAEHGPTAGQEPEKVMAKARAGAPHRPKGSAVRGIDMTASMPSRLGRRFFRPKLMG